MALIGGPGPSPWLYDDRLKMNGVKFTLDGALGRRGVGFDLRRGKHHQQTLGFRLGVGAGSVTQGTRVVANPRGYVTSKKLGTPENKGFRPDFLVEI